ncbi:response regulator transcription factor [Anaeromyxobacter oryzae]|uniref:Helix-turn-helix transcriptional regulator n=1 Tax=Anaeromyxobacter oryzae TaxID=2918170 RepID=A0ABN6MUD0_9BACT|nr:response regulator transcription factor [Anaeromyxobacter oryzae]BDG04541.1 helix-turn-helix transcriptional regulator [Anaeromyxobacter oryzae]
MEPVPVLVVSPDPLARGGLAARVAARAELALAGESAPRDAGRLAAESAPEVVLWDLGAGPGGAGGLAALGDVPVLALAADEAQAAEALRAGARGVIFRGAPPEVLAAAAIAAARGLEVLDPALAGGFVRPPEAPEPDEPLTPREREVLALLAEGLANKAIASRLGISEHTAKFHVNAILSKLGAGSRAEAIVRAARMGLVVL